MPLAPSPSDTYKCLHCGTIHESRDEVHKHAEHSLQGVVPIEHLGEVENDD